MTEDKSLSQCPVCSEQANNAIELEDHIVEEHPEEATPDMQDSYSSRHPGSTGKESDAA